MEVSARRALQVECSQTMPVRVLLAILAQRIDLTMATKNAVSVRLGELPWKARRLVTRAVQARPALQVQVVRLAAQARGLPRVLRAAWRAATDATLATARREPAHIAALDFV